MEKSYGADNQQAILSEALAYITGIYLSDGSLMGYGPNSLSIRVTDRDICEHTKKCFDALLHKPHKVLLYKEEREEWVIDRVCKCKPMYKVVAHSTYLAGWLLTQTQGKHFLPEGWWNADRTVLRELIAGVMDGDGFICSSGPREYQLQLAGKHGYVLDFLGLLEHLQIRYGKVKKHESGLYRYTINKKSFVKAGCYFHCERKQKRLRDYTRDVLNNPPLHSIHRGR